MDEVKTSKTVKEVFKDYNSNSFVLNAARVIGIDLYKKKNLLEVFIASNKLIDINDVLELEKYMERRFQIQTAKLTIKYELEEEVDVSEKIAKEWQSIVKYISYKHPIARAFLNNSEIQIVNNNIKVTLFLNGKEFLESNKFNEVFAGLIYNIYGKKYTMTYEEKVSENTVTQYKERLERLEKEAILEMTKDNGTASAEHSEKPQQETKQYANKTAGQSKYNKGQYNKSQYNKGQYGEKKQYNKSAQNPAQEAPMPPMPDAPEAVAVPEEDTPLIYGRSLNLSDPIIKIQDIGVDSGNVILEGQILSVELDAKDDDINLGIKVRELKSGKSLVIFSVYDGTNTIDCKVFSAPEKLDKLKKRLKSAARVRIAGTAQFDPYAKQLGVLVNTIVEMPEEKKAARTDNAKIKRVELHTHSKMSAMDGIGNVSDYINQVAKWGHKAIAVTDHGNVQSFPEAQAASLKAGIKMIYGVELNMIEPYFNIVFNEIDMSIEDATYVSFDLETTGFSVIHDGITEFGAVKIKNGEVIDRLQSFVNPGKKIGTRVSQLTNITNEMVADAPTIKEFLPQILEFFGDAILVAHNAKFDIGFLNESLKRLNQKPITNPVIDSLALARAIMKPMKSYRLGNVCRVYRVNYDDDVAHRADYDAEVLGAVFTTMLHSIMQSGNYNLLDLNKLQKDDAYKIVFPYHMTALALNKEGLKNMFKIVSEANTTYFHDGARIPKERLEYYRKGLLYGTSCYRSDVFEAA